MVELELGPGGYPYVVLRTERMTMHHMQGQLPRQKAGWSDRQLRQIILKLGKQGERSPDQEILMRFLRDAAIRRKQTHRPC